MTATHLRPRFPLSTEELDAFCRRHRIVRLAVFGSILRDDFHADSDVDLLVEYEAGYRPSLTERLQIKDELGASLGRDVDLLTFTSVTQRVRGRVLADAQVQYDRNRGGVLAILADDGITRRSPTMAERDQLYLGQMVDAAKEAIGLLEGVQREHYEGNRILRLALERLVQNVGEAARRVSPPTRAAHPDIPWQRITGMRNILVHEYDHIDNPTVWDVLRQDLPVLIAELEPLVGDPPSSPASGDPVSG